VLAKHISGRFLPATGLVDEPRINHDRFLNTLTEHRLRAVLTVDMPNLACVAGKLDGFVQQRPRRGGHVPRYHVEDVTVASGAM